MNVKRKTAVELLIKKYPYSSLVNYSNLFTRISQTLRAHGTREDQVCHIFKRWRCYGLLHAARTHGCLMIRGILHGSSGSRNGK